MSLRAGCGNSKVTGHGESSICGQLHYTEIWYCETCLKKVCKILIEQKTILIDIIETIKDNRSTSFLDLEDDFKKLEDLQKQLD